MILQRFRRRLRRLARRSSRTRLGAALRRRVRAPRRYLRSDLSRLRHGARAPAEGVPSGRRTASGATRGEGEAGKRAARSRATAGSDGRGADNGPKRSKAERKVGGSSKGRGRDGGGGKKDGGASKKDGRGSKKDGGRKRRVKAADGSALGTFGTRIGHHAGIYGVGQGASIVMGLVTLAVLTRLLPPPEFGRYALLYAFASLLTMIYTLGWVRGGMLWVFGSGGDDDDDEEDEKQPDATAEDKRRALGSTYALVAAIAGVGTILVALLGPDLTGALGGDAALERMAVMAGGAGAAGAVLNVATQVTRRERRPTSSVSLTLARPVLILAVTVPLVATEPTVDRAVLGLAIGTAAAALISLVAVRRSFSFAVGTGDLANILRLGLRYAPLIVALWVIANAGVFFVGAYAGASAAGYFRVASGVAVVSAVPVFAFLMAWGPLRRDPIYAAVEAERGKLAAGGVLASYFALAALWILLGLAVGAELLVQVAPPSYAAAAPLIPIIGLGFLLRGCSRVVRRAGKIPRSWLWYVVLMVIGAVIFVVACFLLVPPLGSMGAALAIAAAFGFAAIGMFIRSQAGSDPIPLARRRIVGGALIAAGCYAAAVLLDDVVGPAAPVVELAAFLAYPPLLALTRIVPRAHLKPLRGVAVAAVPGRRQADGRVELGGLDDSQRAIVEMLVRERRPAPEVARAVGASQEELSSRFVAALRRVGDVGSPSPMDAGIGSYLLSSDPVAARDQFWRRLSSQGADPLEVDALTLTLERLRRAPEGTWR